MLFNKNKFKKINDKKVLHKIGKHWAVVSIAMLGLLAGGAITTGTTTHADANTSIGQNTEASATKPASASNKVMLGASDAQSSANTNSASASSNVSSKASSAVSKSEMMLGATNDNTNHAQSSVAFNLNTLQSIGAAFDHTNSNAKKAYGDIVDEANLSNVNSMMTNGSALSTAVSNVSNDVNVLNSASVNNLGNLVNDFSFVSNGNLVNHWLSHNPNVNVPSLISKLNNYKAFGLSDVASDVESASNMTSLLSANPSASSAFSNAVNDLGDYTFTNAPDNSAQITSDLNEASDALVSASNSDNVSAINTLLSSALPSGNGLMDKFNQYLNVSDGNNGFAKSALGTVASDLSSDISTGSNFYSNLSGQISAEGLSHFHIISNALTALSNNASGLNDLVSVASNDPTVTNVLNSIASVSVNTSNADLSSDLSNAASSLNADSSLAGINAVSSVDNDLSSVASALPVSSSSANPIEPNNNATPNPVLPSNNASSIIASLEGNNATINPNNSAQSSSSDVVNFGGNTTSTSNSTETNPVTPVKKSNHHYNVKNVPVGKSFKFDGMRATRLTTKNHYDYRYASKNIWLHTNLNMTKRNHRATLRKGSEFIVDKLFKLTTKHHHSYYRALINYGGRHDAFAYINGRNSKNMYYYATKHGEHYVYLRKGVEVHRNARFSRHSNVRYLRANRTYRLHKVVKFGKFGLTRIQLSKNRFITANRKFVKLV